MVDALTPPLYLPLTRTFTQRAHHNNTTPLLRRDYVALMILTMPIAIVIRNFHEQYEVRVSKGGVSFSRTR